LESSPCSPAEANKVESGVYPKHDNGLETHQSAIARYHIAPLKRISAFQKTATKTVSETGIDGDFARSYAASVLYLVRPDGYIAFRCLAAKQSLLQSYIDKCFVPL
jgi:hypothetical protein